MKKKRIRLRKYLMDSLYNQWQAGLGKKKNDKVHNGTPGKVHGNRTYITYKQQCTYFADWCINEKGVNDPKEAEKLIPEYMTHLQEHGYSASSLATALCAIAKAYKKSTKAYDVELPKRKRADIKRSRYATEYDKHFSVKNNASLITFGQCTGLRREELEELHGSECRIAENGNIYITVLHGKGGKTRTIMAYGSPEELKEVARLIRLAGDGKIFPKVHAAMDEHYYRGVYACRVYRAHERPLDQLPREEKYYCRKDMKGKVFDVQAMECVSLALGHNRVDTAIASYLYNL